MYYNGRGLSFRKQRPRTNPYRALVLVGLILVSLFVLQAVQANQIRSPFIPTPTPTRTANSFTEEGIAHFTAGNLGAAISAYQQGLQFEPNNHKIWAELARIQAYSSATLTTDDQKRTRLDEAIESINKAVAVQPEDSNVHAIKAFVLNWRSNPILAGPEAEMYLTEAEQEAQRALVLDPQNTLAMAYMAEIYIDQLRFVQSQNYIDQAIAKDPNIMDVQRIYGYVMESMGDYPEAIRYYQEAVNINPNLTFLYIRIGVNYRQLKQYDLALEYFAKAANINEQLGIQDPLPYIAIGKTYSQIGEFFAAAKNVQKAVLYDPTNPEVYATLGMVYYKSRNYESAIVALKCSVKGCTAAESCEARQGDPCETFEETYVVEGMPLSASTVVNYYTYASALAGLHRSYNNYCEESLSVLRQVRTGFSADESIIQIVKTNEDICASFGYSVP